MRITGLLGILGLCLAMFVPVLSCPFLKQWFYVLVWWSYILTIDGVIYALKKESLIISRTKEFLLMLPLSTSVWLVFECFNLRLTNWSYIDITPILWQRWLGYAIAYATVFPGIFLTAELLGLFIGRSQVTARNSQTLHALPSTLYASLSVLTGIIFLSLPLLWPKYFFALVWVGFIPLLEPLNLRWGHGSIWKDWLSGNKVKIYRLAVAGLVCGILWESWNASAQAKWIYQVPYVHFWQIHEMPLLGYLGFIPFAFECVIIYNFIKGVYRRFWSRARILVCIGSLAVIVIWWWWMFWAIDTYTVKSFAF